MPHLKNLKKCINKLIQELKNKEVSMDVRIQSIHFDASEQLQAFIQKKVSKLEKYYEDIKKNYAVNKKKHRKFLRFKINI